MRRPGADLRPLTTPEALDAAVILVWHAAPRYYAIATAGALPVVAMMLYYYHWAGTLLRGQAEADYWQGTFLWALAMAAAWMFLSIARGALTAAALADARGEPVAPADCWRAALRRAPSLMLIGSLGTAGLWLGALAPLFYWMVARPVVMDEDPQGAARWPTAAPLRRSAELTRGYRGKAFRLWLLFLLVWIVAAANLYLFVELLLSGANTFFGMEVSALSSTFSYNNRAYLVWLAALVFLLLEPLKTCADAALYLDLRIRREGADLQTRLRALPAALGLLLLLIGLPARAGAMTLEEYRRQVRELEQAVRAARHPEQVPAPLRRDLASGTVKNGEAQSVSFENRWLRNALSGSWKSPEEKERLLNRIQALERSLGDPGDRMGVGEKSDAHTPIRPHDATVPRADPDAAYQQAIARPEFQELADRPELRRLASQVRPARAGTWFEKLWEWIKKHLLKPPDPKPQSAPATNFDPNVARWILYGLLGLAAAVLLALVLRALFLRWQERGSRKATPAAPAPLEQSATENALDHSVDEWEAFAAEWFGRGDLRQAVRALYLALLVNLHQQRLIDYNRAFTNWHYVRRFAGAPDQRQVLRRLTERFDLSWYGRRPCSPEQYQEFAAGVRSLVKGELGGGAAHA